MKHLVQKPHILFTTENPRYGKSKLSLDQAISNLKAAGAKVYKIQGHYGSPENSILIEDPTPQHIRIATQMAGENGQESIIISNGKNHKMIYLNGPNKGKIEHGEGTVFHKEKPSDYYSILPDGTIFTHNFGSEKLDKKDKSEHSKQELAPDQAKLKPLMKPYVSEAQRRWAHTPAGIKALGGKKAVEHWDKESKGKKLPERIEKGAQGDWKKEGYTFAHYHNPEIDQHRIKAFASSGEVVGSFIFENNNGKWMATSIQVKEPHRRKGLASAALSLFESKTGNKLYPHTDRFGESKQSPDAKALWAQPNRPFGKSLQKSSFPSAPKININPEHGKIIADAYHNMKHEPHHPEVKASYNALINETKKQYKDLLEEGFRFTKVSDPSKYPYKNSKEMHHDIEHNKHLYYLSTEADTFGPDSTFPKDHPLLQPVEFTDNEGKPMLANDLLRQVHDINGHFKGGKTTFGPKGEHAAYIHHKKMYSEKAQPALANELLMQNNYVNFGPNGEHNRKNPANTIYAPQKVGLVPEWIWKGKWHGET
jgi:hypothetical protein